MFLTEGYRLLQHVTVESDHVFSLKLFSMDLNV